MGSVRVTYPKRFEAIPADLVARMRTADDSWTRNTPDHAETGETVLVERREIPGV